ncbi:MAG: hypothetical protein U5J78_03425 [Parasphingorhabdus sp.]|nr:hypothetical protein [Parasphingorhabdus sp.]
MRSHAVDAQLAALRSTVAGVVDRSERAGDAAETRMTSVVADVGR